MSRRQKPLFLSSRAAAPAPAQAGHRPLLLVLALAAGFAGLQAHAQPAGAQAVVGTAALSQQGNKLTVTTTNGAGGFSAINWQSFSVPGGTVTHFAQPGAASTSLNRVVGPDPSAIFGTLSSNGRLVLVNPNGITVGAGAVVDTAAFTASTLKMSDADFLAGRLRFADPIGGLLKVDGQVLARSGDVVLIGQQVETGPQAVVQSPQGATVLAAGQKVEVTGRGLEGIVFEVQAPTDQALNLGTLRGDAVGVFAGTLRHSGLVQAQAVTAEGGRVVLKAAGKASVAGGAVEAQALGDKGGSVDVLGSRVELTEAARIDASGANGGGQVRLGGDYQGANSAIANAQETLVSADSQVRANATGNGNGGRVIVWADDTTRAYGRLEAKAGPQGGDGGFIETSGKNRLDVNGISVDASSAKGAAGTWLLDPSDIRVVHGTLGSANFAPTVDSTITDATLNNAIDGGTSVVVSTAGGQLPSPGDITFDGVNGTVQIVRTAAGGNTISFVSDRDISFINGLTKFEAGGGSSLGVTLSHGAGSAKVQQSGTLHVGGGASVTTTSLSVLGGTLTVDGAIGAAAFAQDGGSTTTNGTAGFGSMAIAGGAFQVAGGTLQTDSFSQTNGGFGAGGMGSVAVGSSFSSTGGTFDFNGANLAIVQAVGDLVIPGGNGLISASGMVSLSAANGGLTVNRMVSAGQEASLGATGVVKVAGVRTFGSRNNATGRITITGSSVESVSGPAAIEARGQVDGGGSGQGGSGGNVSITATNGHISLGSIDTQGGEGTLGNGAGGAVSLAANDGLVSVDLIRTDAGQRSGAHAPGGNGGNVSVTTTGSAALGQVQLGAITAQGSFGGGGSGGNVDVSGVGSVSIDMTRAPGSSFAVSTRGWEGAGAASSGNISITSQAGSVAIVGGLDSTSDGSLGGSTGLITLSAAAAGQDVTAQDLMAYASMPYSGVGYGMNGGAVNVTAGRNVTLGNVIASGSGGQGDGGSGGDVTVTAGGQVTVAQVQAFGSNGTGLGGTGGDITIAAGGPVMVLGGANVTSSAIVNGGGQGTDGGSGGAVSISSTGGGITVLRNISSGGGNATSGLAGDGGAVRLTATGSAGTTPITTDRIFTTGGHGPRGGRGGDVTVTTSGDIQVGSSDVSILAQGGNGQARTGGGGNVSLASSGGRVKAAGVIQTLAGFPTMPSAPTMGGAGGSIRVSAATSVELGGLFAWGSTGQQTFGRGGEVSVTANGGNLTVGDISTRAFVTSTQDGQSFFTTIGGAGGHVTLAATGGAVMAGNITSVGGGTTTTGSAGGNVRATAAGGVTVGAITTSAGRGDMDGGNAGSVTLASSGGSVSTGLIQAHGGGASSGTGGLGGNVSVSGAAGVTAQSIDTSGMAGADGGSAGSITIASSGGHIVAGVLTAGAGGAFYSGTAGKAGTVGISGGGMVTLQGINTSGQWGGTGSDGGNIAVTAAGDIWITGSSGIEASGGGGSLGPGPGGGTVTIASSGGDVTVSRAWAFGGYGTIGGAGGNITVSAPNGTAAINSLDASGGGALVGGGTGGTGGAGGNVTITAGQGVVLGEIYSEGGWGGYGPTSPGTGGQGGNISVTVSQGDLDLSTSLLSVAGGTGGDSDLQGGTGGQGGRLVITSTSGSVFTSSPGEAYGTELIADGGRGGFLFDRESVASSRGGTGGKGGSIVINSGSSAYLYGDMSAGGGEGGGVSNYATANAIGGTGGAGGNITVNVTGAGQSLTLGGRINAGGGAPGLADFDPQTEDDSIVTARTGAAGTVVGTFTANAEGGVFIPSSPVTPIVGQPFDPLHVGASLAINANWTNNGALALHSGAWLVSGRPIVNNGAIELGFDSVVTLGSIGFDGEANPVFSPLTNTLINGSAGIVRGFGTIDGHLVNQGTVSPGMSYAPFGQITVNGHYTQSATGRLVIDAEAQGPYFPGTNHDQFRVLGAVTLGGSLQVNETVLPVSQAAYAVDGPTAQQLAPGGSDSILFLDAPTGIAASSGFSSITAPDGLRSLLLVQNGTTLQTVDGLVVTPPAPTPAPPSPAPSPSVESPAPAPTPVASPAPAPTVATSDAGLVDSAVELAGNASREVVQEALTQAQATTATFASSKPDEKKEEKADTEVITTTTSCKPA